MLKTSYEVQLPVGFESLQKFVSDWALSTQVKREARRREGTPEQLQEFYDEMMLHIEAILKAVDKYPIGGLPQPEEILFRLAFSLAEIAPSVELYGGDILVTHLFDETRFNARHGDHQSTTGLHNH